MSERLYRAQWNEEKRQNIGLKEFLDFTGNKVSFFSLNDSTFCQFDEKDTLISAETLNAEDPEYKAFCSQLNPFKISCFETTKWVCYDTNKEYAFMVSIYSLNDESKRILLNTVDNILMQDKDESCLKLPQDLCFFRTDGTFLLGTVSHEDMIVCSLKQEEINLLEKFHIFEPCPSDFFRPKLNLTISIK